jgi:RarD protein
MIALVRGFVGAFFVLLFVYLKKSRIDKEAIRKNFRMLALSGAFIGINWILLFESYNYTTVATATICYYMEPIFVILASPFLLKEKLTAKKAVCAAFALLGMVFVSGVLETGIPSFSEARGVLYGLGAACFYATVVLMNKKITDINAYDKTIMQLGMGAIVLSPYVMLTQDFGTAALSMTPALWALLLFVGLVHTGVAYALYFDALKDLKAQTVAIFSYIDPIVAIILSALLLKESMGIYGIIGAILVLGSTFISEMPEKERN